ncbi:MAG: alpha/beta hydrolase-fold protein [Pseudomonadota bacterium]
MDTRPLFPIAILLGLTVAGCGGGGRSGADATVLEVSQDIVALDSSALLGVHEDRVDDLPSELPPLPDIPPETSPPADVAQDLGEDVPSTPGLDMDLLMAALGAGDGDGIDAQMVLYDGPVCDEETCLVVTWLPEHDVVAIRGEFNAWEEEAMEASPLAGWFWAVVPAAVVDGCKQYKLFADDQWFPDPLNRWIGFADIAINSALCPAGVSRIALVEGVYSPQLDNTRSLYVYVPAPAFDDPGATFPVLYMQDGFNVFTNPMTPFGAWEIDGAADALIATGEVAPLIIVGVDTDDRMDEYLYAGITVDLGGGPIQVTPLLPDYAEFLVDVVKPLVDERFPTKPGRGDTAIAGSSLGGISSLWIAWHHADVFGRVASFSGSYWVGQEGSGTEGHPTMESVLQQASPSADQLALKIYMDSGTLSSMGQPGQEYTGDGRSYTDWTRNVLIDLGWDNRPEWDDDGDLETAPADFPISSDPAGVPTLYWSPTVPAGYADWGDYLGPDRNLLHLVGEGHAHNEAAWAARSGAMLRFLFPGS